ncbi:MAG: methyltransferase domain-containing protein [Mycobacteriaceae bacterium]|nr:methyltransferase domain-containing protein [Mycobacteriaceae bacterium]
MPQWRLTEETAGLIDMLVYAPNLAQALYAAHELGVFRYLADQQATPEAVAEHCGMPLESFEMLLGVLRAMDLVHVGAAGALELNPAVAPRLTGDLARHLPFQQEIVYPGLAHLAAALRSGTNSGVAAFPGAGATLYDRLAGTRLERILHDHLHATSSEALPGLIGTGALGGVRHLLDIGGGTGTNALAVAHAHPDLEITIVDIPSVVKLASDNIAEHGLSERIHAVAADVFVDRLPGGADAALLAHMLPIFTPGENIALLENLHHNLPDGGKVLIFDPMLDDDEAGPLGSAAHRLYLNCIAAPGARLWSGKSYEEWLRAAGFTEIHRYPGLPAAHGVRIGTKHSSE